ncbi:MAG: hypothetical protein HY302_01360 [Opitutae bacterium]|nr:hypothetical protein [Opitutae bacterium]
MLKLLPTKKAGPSVSSSDADQDPVGRSVEIGLVCTILFHVLLFWLAPHLTMTKITGTGTGFGVRPKQRDFNFQLAPGDVPKPPPKKDPTKFVETNPDAPENTPDKTDNFSNRNQQSAQTEAAKEKDPENRPSVKGQDEIKSDNIVTGEKAPMQLGAPPTPAPSEKQEQDQAEQKARAQQTPLSGTEKFAGKSADGVASEVAESDSPSNRADRLQLGRRDATDATGGLYSTNAASNRPQPRARPRLTPVRPSILSNRIAGTPNVGIQGIDARWSEYGDYMQEFIDIVDAQWRRINAESAVSPPSGTYVIVTFKLKSNGETEMVSVDDGHANNNKPAVYTCQAAIEARQPYRKWTDQMIAVLGDSQTITFTFYYY